MPRGSSAVTKDDLRELVQHFDAKFDRVDQRLEQVDRRVDQRFDQVDERLDRVDERLDQVDERFDQVDQSLDGIDQRLDHVDERLHAQGVTLEHAGAKIALLSEGLDNTRDTLVRQMEQMEARLDARIGVLERIVTEHSAELHLISSNVSRLTADVAELRG